MVRYIAQIALGMIHLANTSHQSKVCTRLPGFVRELRKLDARDFTPDVQEEFVVVLAEAEEWAKFAEDRSNFINNILPAPTKQMELQQLLHRVIAVLEKYGGEGWRVKTRDFSFIKDAGLREIIERDYKEVTLVLFPGGAWKSTVVIAGGILEAVLFDQLTVDPVTNAKVLASPKAPKRGGAVLPLDDWKLEGLIKVAADIGLFDKAREDTFDQVLRDYRNFIHPKKEIRAAHPCREGEAQLAIGALNAICDTLQ